MAYSVQGVDLTIATIIAVFSLLIILITLLGQIIRVRLHMSDILILLGVGIAFGFGIDINIESNLFFPIILWASRLVIAFQLMATALSVGADYVRLKWKNQVPLLLITMPLMWITSSVLIYLIFQFNFTKSLLIGGILTPTDPILAATIVRGSMAEKNLPKRLRDLISAESGANDGLAFPFIQLPLLLLLYSAVPGKAVGEWFYWTWLYQIILAVLYSLIIGALTAKALTISEEKKVVDRSTYLVYTTGLALFLLTTSILMDMNELIAVFFGGLGFVIFAKRDDVIQEEQIQESVDLLSTFLFFFGFGLIVPWDSFSRLGVGWLFLSSLLILPFRRIFYVLALYRIIPDLEDAWEALFVGWFGPVGVAALYYGAVIFEELGDDDPFVIASFVVLASTVIYGVTSASFTRLLGYHIRGKLESNRTAVGDIEISTLS